MENTENTQSTTKAEPRSDTAVGSNPWLERAEQPQAGDRYDKHGKTVVVDEVSGDRVKWSYLGGHDYIENVSDISEWRRLARKTIERGALFTPRPNGRVSE